MDSVQLSLEDIRSQCITSSRWIAEQSQPTVRDGCAYLCNIVCNKCAQCDAHTYEQTNSSQDWVLSHCAHFTVLIFIFACIMCIIVYCVHV